MKRLKYVLVYTLPIIVMISFQLKGYATFLTVAVFFWFGSYFGTHHSSGPFEYRSNGRFERTQKEILRLDFVPLGSCAMWVALVFFQKHC